MEKVEVLILLVALMLIVTIVSVSVTFDIQKKVNSFNEKLDNFTVTVDQPSNNKNPPSQPDSPAQPSPPPSQQPSKVTVNTEGDPFLGPENASVVVVEFSDFECPYCQASYGTQDTLVARFKSQDPTWEAAVPKLKELANQGKIKFVYKDFPLSSIHANAQKAAEASECADEQGKFWEYHDTLFEKQTLDIASLKQHAVDLGLDADQFNECLDSGAMASEVQEDLQQGSSYGVSGTPSFFVNGFKISGAQSFSAFESLIEQESES